MKDFYFKLPLLVVVVQILFWKGLSIKKKVKLK